MLPRRHRRRGAARGHRARRRDGAAVPRPATSRRSPRRSAAASTMPSCAPASARPDASGSSSDGAGSHCAQLTVDQYREVLAMPANVAKLRAERPPALTARRDADRSASTTLGLQPGELRARRRRRLRSPRVRSSPAAAPTSSPSTTPPSEVVGTRATFGGDGRRRRDRPRHYAGVLRGDATRLPFADGTFDRVITSEVLEHIQDDVAALAELARVLKPRRRVRRDGAELAAGEDQLDAERRVPRPESRRRPRAHLLARPS